MFLTHFSPLRVERSQNIGLTIKIPFLTIIHFYIWKMIWQGSSLFEHSLLWRGSAHALMSSWYKFWENIWKQKPKAPTCGHCAEVGRKRPFHHRGLAPFVTWPAVGTYGTLNVASLPSLPPEIIWQCPFDQRRAAAPPMEVLCIM